MKAAFEVGFHNLIDTPYQVFNTIGLFYDLCFSRQVHMFHLQVELIHIFSSSDKQDLPMLLEKSSISASISYFLSSLAVLIMLLISWFHTLTSEFMIPFHYLYSCFSDTIRASYDISLNLKLRPQSLCEKYSLPTSRLTLKFLITLS